MLSNAWREHQEIRYLAVGAWNTLFAYAIFGVLYLLLHGRIHYLIISLCAHFVAVANAFVCQRWLVFKSRMPWLRAFVRFNLVQLMALAWGLAALAFMVEVLHWNPLISQLVTMAVAAVGSYLLHRGYSFRA
jgi:putative flippase GtrA